MSRWHGIAAVGTLAVLVALVFWWTERTTSNGELVPTAPPPNAAPASPAAPALTETAAAATADPARTEATPDVARSATPAPNFPQGLRGLVVDERHRPLAGLGVYLVDSAGNAPLAMPLLRRQRDALGPAASTETAADGTFAVGLPVAQDRFYELYVLSPDHATTRLGGLRLLAGEWHDLGTLTMTAGASLRGRVSVGGRSDLPVPGATVTVEIGAVFADAALRALPGANQGLSTTTDAAGRYELHHVPSRGVVQVVAVASGFARARRPDIELRPDQAVEVDFALLPGQTLAGTVVDGKGNGVAEARIEAWPQQAAGEALVGLSDANGHFDVLGLQPGRHRVRVLARGYDTAEQRDLEAGRNDLRFTLQEQSRLRVRVLTPRGETLRSYQLALRRAFRDQPAMIAAVVDVPEQRVRLDGMTDYAELRNVPPGLFRCQVEAEGFARTLSAEVDNERRPNDAEGPRALEIVVTMSTGVSLGGRVVDETGAVLAGATVSTQPAGTMPDNPISRMLAGAVPDVISRTRTTTATDGTFALPRLALGDYQLLVEHDAACRTIVRDLRLDREGDRVLPPIVMVTGAQVTGRATVAGRVAGQVKVVLSTPASLANAADALRKETVTDAAGNFRIPGRVPPGTYELRAAVVGTSEPEAQAFRQLLQLQRSAVTLEIPRGSRQIERDIDLPSAN